METASEPKLRIMLDANLLISGIGWVRFPYEVLRHAVNQDYQLVLCPRLIEEARMYVERLFPEKLPAFETFLNDSHYESVPNPSQEAIEANAKLVRDYKDVYLAVAAIDASVDFLITQDRDFTDHDESTRELHEKLNVILPGTFLREYMGWTSEELEAIRERTWDDMQ